MSDTTRYLITLSERQVKALPELQRRTGITNRNELFRKALAHMAETYDVSFPDDFVKPGKYKRKKHS